MYIRKHKVCINIYIYINICSSFTKLHIYLYNESLQSKRQIPGVRTAFLLLQNNKIRFDLNGAGTQKNGRDIYREAA